jgi:hypothetical protein
MEDGGDGQGRRGFASTYGSTARLRLKDERDGRPRGRGERRSKSKEREGCCGPGQGPREAVVVSGRVLAGNGRSRCLWTPEMRAATDQRLR